MCIRDSFHVVLEAKEDECFSGFAIFVSFRIRLPANLSFHRYFQLVGDVSRLSSHAQCGDYNALYQADYWLPVFHIRASLIVMVERV